MRLRRLVPGECRQRPRRLRRLLCGLLGHRWHQWEAGHVYADEATWIGPRTADGTPWAPSFRSCDRCGVTDR